MSGSLLRLIESDDDSRKYAIMAKDWWSSDRYQSAAGFVPALSSKVVSYLDPQSEDRILDIGAGDGKLTAQIAQHASSGQVLGLDASKSFISTAQQSHGGPNCTFKVQDCRKLEECSEAVNGSWDKVFSNAACHWILGPIDSRAPFFRNIHEALKPGGRFVFEMGGHGNVAEVQAACIAALIHAGLSAHEAANASPWFFPNVDLMQTLLSDAGFEVEICEHEYRSTKLTADTTDQRGGLRGWVHLMCAEFVEVVSEEKRGAVFEEICDVVDPVITRPEDGSKWMGYCRLRAVARKR